MLDWVHRHEVFAASLLAASVVAFVSTLIMVPWVIVRLPSDHFAQGHARRLPWAGWHPVIRMLLVAGKNTVGSVFVLLGIAMLVLPGQGILTIVVGLMLIDFPGKYRLERWAVSRRPVMRAINWLRERANRPALQFTVANEE